MQFARLNGVSLHYQVINAAADRPRLVFANSLGTDFRIWRDVVVRLAGDFSILTYDKRGHGLSDIGPSPYAIADHAADLAALIDHTGFGPAIVCGISVGGLIAQGLYASRPDLVTGLALCDTAHKIGTADGWNDRIAAVEAKGSASIADAVLARWFTEHFRRSENAALNGYRNMLVRTPIAGYAGTCAAIRDADFTDAAGRIAVPTVCLVGESDGATPPDLVQSLAELIPGARYELIRGAGHLPCIEQPAAVTAILRNLSSLIGVPDGRERRH